MKKLYLMLVALMVGFTAKADWTFYVDVSNTSWNGAVLHCGTSSGWWSYYVGQPAGKNVYKFEVPGWDELFKIAFDENGYSAAPQSPYYGNFTVGTGSSNIVNGACYVLDATTPGATITPNFTPPEYTVYCLGRNFAEGQSWQGDLPMTQDGNVWTVGPLDVTKSTCGTFGIRKITVSGNTVSETWFASPDGNINISEPMSDMQLASSDKISNIRIAKGTWTFTYDPDNNQLSVDGSATPDALYWAVYVDVNNTDNWDNIRFTYEDGVYVIKDFTIGANGGSLLVYNNFTDWYGAPSNSGTITEGSGASLTLNGATTSSNVKMGPGVYDLQFDPETKVLSIGKAASTIVTVADPIIAPGMDTGAPLDAMPEVSISCDTEGATIYYTTGDEEFSTDTWTLYTEPFTPEGNNVTVRAIAVKDGMNNSNVVEATYVVKVTETVATPVITPESGSDLAVMPEVTISSDTDGAIIYYTTGTTEFSPEAWYIYTGPFTPEGDDVTIKAIAVKPGMNNSEVSTATFSVSATEPALVPIYMLVSSNLEDLAPYVTTDPAVAEHYECNMVNNDIATFIVDNWVEGTKFIVGVLEYNGFGGNQSIFTNGKELENNQYESIDKQTRLTVEPGYMTLPSDATGKRVTFSFNIVTKELLASWEPGSTGIDEITFDVNGSAVYYTLQGVRVDNPTTSGIYIRLSGDNAQKVMIR